MSDVNEVIQKFLTQEETQNNLLNLTKENQARIDQLQEERARLRAKVRGVGTYAYLMDRGTNE